jgi:methionyl aminopeptidase
MTGKSSATLKSPEEIRIMDEANAIVWSILEKVAAAVAPGVSTHELDQLAERECRSAGAVPTFKGYGGYPKSICISLNDVIVHGIPSPRIVIRSGDVVSIDFGVTWLGFCGDAALTVAVGDVPANAENLIRVTRECLDRAVEQCRPGQRVGDISHAVQSHAEKHGLAVVRDFVGHGIGRSMHEPPQVPNYGSPGEGPALEAGMVLAIEPMICEGTYRVTVDEDGWTARTADGALAAHFEYSVAVTAAGPRVLGAGSR